MFTENQVLSIQEIWQQFISNVRETRWPEWVSTVTQIASVWYARKNNVLVYPTGIIGVLLAAYVYFFMISPPLYADAALNIYYFGMSVQLGTEKRRGTLHLPDQLVYKIATGFWDRIFFVFLGCNLFCAGKIHRQQYAYP
jgi:hypothetical protein